MLLCLSSYIEKFEQEAKAWYLEKIALINGVYPFVGNITKVGLFDGYPPVSSVLLDTLDQFYYYVPVLGQKGVGCLQPICEWVDKGSKDQKNHR